MKLDQLTWTEKNADAIQFTQGAARDSTVTVTGDVAVTTRCGAGQREEVRPRLSHMWNLSTFFLVLAGAYIFPSLTDIRHEQRRRRCG